MNQLDQIQKKLKVFQREWDHTSRQIKIERAAVTSANIKVLAAEEAQSLVQQVAAVVQQRVHKRIAGVVSRCLSAVFGEDAYAFDITFEKRRGRTEADLSFVRDGYDFDPMSSSGGGVVDVAAFALRLSCIMLTKPAIRKVLILDEPLKFLSPEYQPLVPQMFLSLAIDLGFQFIVVTNLPIANCGKVVNLGDDARS